MEVNRYETTMADKDWWCSNGNDTELKHSHVMASQSFITIASTA